MPRQATKAVGNRYYEARMQAAKYNEKLLTRAGAAECLPGVMEDSLKKYELDITRPPNVVVALMADTYNAPELRSWYCANECPLGKDRREMPVMPPERVVIRLQNTLKLALEIPDTLAEFMDDGVLDADEARKMPELYEQFLELRRRVDEGLAVMEKAMRSGQFQ